MDDDKYPHWKDALFGNHNAVANLRCAVHYVFWHALYALIAVAGAIVVGAIKLGKAVAPYLGPLASPVGTALDRLFDGVTYVMNHRYTQKAFEGFMVICAIGLLVGGVGALVYYLYTMFWTTVGILGGVVLGFGVLIGLIILTEYLRDPAANVKNSLAAGANRAGHKAVQTPGVRRVYGECPVSMEQAPKWFDNLFPEDDL